MQKTDKLGFPPQLFSLLSSLKKIPALRKIGERDE